MEAATRINYFGVWLKITPTVQISRDTFAVIDKRSSTWSPRIALLRKSLYKTSEERKKVFDDDECKIYSDLWCEDWRKKCLLNFDLNMAFFEQIKQPDFDAALSALIRIKKMREIFDLNECKEMSGIYVMVLDKYKQMYIGQATDIKKRILKHWSAKKPFDRLLFGRVENSVLSIDSFGALDTTRIFVLKTHSLDTNEKSAIHNVPDVFILNRVGGGRPADVFDTVEVLASANHRDMRDLK